MIQDIVVCCDVNSPRNVDNIEAELDVDCTLAPSGHGERYIALFKGIYMLHGDEAVLLKPCRLGRPKQKSAFSCFWLLPLKKRHVGAAA